MKHVFFFALITVFASSALAQQNGTMAVKLYFLNEKSDPGLMNCQDVKPVTRTIPKTSGVAKAALTELFKGVNEEEAKQGFVSFEAASTSGILKNINIKGGAAYVNFDKIVLEKLGAATSSCGGGLFSSIEHTLYEFPSIDKVYYAIEGNTNEFYEWVQVGNCPYGKKHCSSANFK